MIISFLINSKMGYFNKIIFPLLFLSVIPITLKEFNNIIGVSPSLGISLLISYL